MRDSIISHCGNAGQRRMIAQVLQGSRGHPDVQKPRASGIGATSVAICRTSKLCEEKVVPHRLRSGDGRARFQDAKRNHQHHLIDMNPGEVTQVTGSGIEALQERIAARPGYQLAPDGVPLKKDQT